jgi:NADPH2:quinone reductase
LEDEMRAVVISRFGGPDVLELREIDTPQPSAGELLVRVICSGTNPVDTKLRADGTWARMELPVVLGYDVSGVVEKVGPGVSSFVPGDEVFYTPEIFGNRCGSYAEFNVVPATIVARKPAGLSHEEAAAVPLAGGTAWEAVVRRMALRPGETVLIHGGAGGVGSFGVQFAKAAGARVLATAGTANQGVLQRLGVDVAVDYTKEDVVAVALRETGGSGVDAVFSTVGGDTVAKSVAATRPFGRMACILTPAGSLDAFAFKNLTLFGIFLTREAARLQEMAKLIEQRQLRPLVDRVLPLEEVRQAHERLESGHGAGKIVLRVAP